MGIKMAPSYANNCIGELEERLLLSSLKPPLSWVRYIDDVDMKWIHSDKIILNSSRLLSSMTSIDYLLISDLEIQLMTYTYYLALNELSNNIIIKFFCQFICPFQPYLINHITDATLAIGWMVIHWDKHRYQPSDSNET
jgi:hypothetical protein